MILTRTGRVPVLPRLRAIVCGEVDNSNTVNEDGKTAAQEAEERRREAARKAGGFPSSRLG